MCPRWKHNGKCKECGIVYKTDLDKHFPKDGRGGLRQDCRACNRASGREYYQANREERLAKQRKYDENNKEKIAVYQEKYREDHKEELQAFERKRQADPAYAASIIVRQAEQRGIDADLDVVESVLTLRAPCYLCGEEAPEGALLRLDRVDNIQGYLDGNCAPCCARCNKAKNSHNLLHYLQHLVLMYAKCCDAK